MKNCLACFLFIVGALNSFGRPANVILFLVDDMGWMDSSAYGSKYYETPNMDRLAKQSMRFTDAFQRAQVERSTYPVPLLVGSMFSLPPSPQKSIRKSPG